MRYSYFADKQRNMKTSLPESISSIEEAKKIIKELHQNDELFHFDDSPFDIIMIGTDNRLFTDEEAEKISFLLDQIFLIDDFDPYQYACDITSESIML